MDIKKQNMNEMLEIVKKYNLILSDSTEMYILPFIIYLIGCIIILVYIVKIEVNINGKDWQINKCSSKYVFFSGFLNNENMDPIKKSIDNFNECVKRFKGNLPNLNQPRERLGDKYQVKRYL
jgi:hypothetical protein